ncbi:MAG: hypothetical protein NTX42_02715 [Methanothrix sp.]|nr:hypothetical protein [Methanothrix sp.]
MKTGPAEILLIQSPAPRTRARGRAPEPERHSGARPGPEGSPRAGPATVKEW